MIFKNNTLYNALKYLALVVFDACGLAYEQLAEVWNLPYGTEVMRTFVIASTFIGALIGIGNIRYNKMPVDTDTSLEDEMLAERDDE